MIVELAGLPGSGKTTFAKKLSSDTGLSVITLHSKVEIILCAAWFFVCHPHTTVVFLKHILKETKRNNSLRKTLLINSLLIPAAKYSKAERRGGILDQGFTQSILSLLPKDDSLILKLLAVAPQLDLLLLCSVEDDIRQERIEKRKRKTRQELSLDEAERFAAQSPKVFDRISFLASEDLVLKINTCSDSDIQKARSFIEKSRVSTTRNTIKEGIYFLCFLLSLSWMFESKKVYVLMYHSISDSPWKHSITPEVFEQQVEYLVKNYKIVSCHDVVDYVEGRKKVTQKAVAITFDDGYKDIYTNALPILKKHKVPATLFIPSDFSTSTSPEHTPRLQEADVKNLAKEPLIAIESHGHSHHQLTSLSVEEVKQEARISADSLQRITGTLPSLFAYPYGSRSKIVEDSIRSAGYRAAFAITEGSVRKNNELYAIRRIQVDKTISFPLFKLRLTGAVDIHTSLMKHIRSYL